MTERDDKADRIAEEVSEQLTRALGHIDLGALARGGRPEPRFGKKRERKPRRSPATTLPGQRLFPFAAEDDA